MASAPHQRRQTEPSRPPASSARPYQEHERAVLVAEARALALTLSSYGILTCDTLEDLMRARRWRQGSFHQALAAAVQMGLIELRPFGFCRYAVTPTLPEPRCSTPDRSRTGE